VSTSFATYGKILIYGSAIFLNVLVLMDVLECCLTMTSFKGGGSGSFRKTPKGYNGWLLFGTNENIKQKT